MKKKVLSTLLAVCLFVGMAVPAVFAAPLSALSGNSDEVTAIKFAKDSYSIAKDDSKDFADQVTAFATNKKLVQEPNLTWELDSQDGKFSISNSTVYALESGATATLTAVSEDGKVKAKIKLTSTAAVPAKKDATGFKFVDRTITLRTPVMIASTGLPLGDAGSTAIEFKIAPNSASTAFTPAQINAIGTAVKAELVALLNAAGATSVSDSATYFAPVKTNDDGHIVVTLLVNSLNADLDNATKVNSFIDALKTTNNLDVTADIGTVAVPRDANAKTTVKATKGVVAGNIGGPSNISIQVGETFELGKKVNVAPSNANVVNTKQYSLDYYGNNSEYEYAVVDNDGKVTGVAVGKTIVVTELTLLDKTVKTVKTVVDVVPAKSTTTTPEVGPAKISATTASIKVGTQVTLSVKDAAKDAKITWKVDNKNVSIDPYTGSATVVRGKVAGTSKVTALVDGVEVGTCTITVAAADTTVTPPTTTPTPNPSTGDSLFANLF